MNITKNNIDALNATLTLKIDKSDYEENVSKVLREYRRKAQIPGFRPGNVPMGMVQKMYGKSVLADEVFKLMDKGIGDYLRDNKVQILGSPIPNEQTPAVDFDTQSEYEFVYDLALIPEVKLELSQKIKIPYYNIKITEEDKQQQKGAYLQSRGQRVKMDTVEGEDVLLRVNVSQAAENGVKVEDGLIITKTIPAEQTQKLQGLKAGENITLNIREVLTNDTDCAAFLHLKKEELEGIDPVVTLSINEISRMQPAELNQEFFDKMYGTGVVTTEADFDARVEAEMREQFLHTSNFLFFEDTHKKLLELANLDLPEATLKRWLKLSSSKDKEKFTDEQLEKEASAFFDNLRWSLITEHIAKQNDIKVEEKDVLEYSKNTVRNQFVMYGITNAPEEEVTKYAADLLGDDKHRSQCAERILEDKVLATVKTLVKIDNKEMSKEDIKKLLAERNQAHSHQ
jgi:trigger factor